MSDDLRAVPPALARLPLSAPLWLWLAYGGLIVGLGALTGSFTGFVSCWMAAAFSFQFWTFAAWRGLRRSPTPEER